MLDREGLDWALRIGQLNLRFRMDGVVIQDVDNKGAIEATAKLVITRPEVLLPQLRGYVAGCGWWVYFHVGKTGVTVRYTRLKEATTAELLLSIADSEGIERDVGYVRMVLDGNWNLRGCAVSDVALTEDFLRGLISSILQKKAKETAQEPAEEKGD